MAEGPLDEKVWSSYPEYSNLPGGIHTNTVLHYFAKSIFFDPTSNNAIVTGQAMYNPMLLYMIQTRDAFERQLRTMSGLEFIVSHDPSENDTVQQHSGIWVIRKQQRRKRPGQDDEITPLSSFFIVGINIYMSPSVGNVLGNRMLNISHALTNSLKNVGRLVSFSTETARRESTGSSQKDSKPQMASFKPVQKSREGTPTPGTPQAAKATKSFATDMVVTEELDERLLTESLKYTLAFKGEYMDEAPLQGEPGSFVMRKSRNDNTLVSVAQTNKPGTPLPPIQTVDLENPMTKGSKDTTKTPVTPGGSKREKKKKRVGSTTTPK